MPNAIRAGWPWPRHLFAEGGHAGEKLRAALADKRRWTLEIVKGSEKDCEKSIAPVDAAACSGAYRTGPP